jgi:hypothetical protein
MTGMIEDRKSIEDPSSQSWLGHLLRFIRNDLDISLPGETIPALRASILALDPVSIHQRILTRCHHFCYPPSTSQEPYFNDLRIQTAHSWPCFQSTADHFCLCHFFVSDNFRHSRLLYQNGVNERICSHCDEYLSVQHWLLCPLRAQDRHLLAIETGYPVNTYPDLREVLSNQRTSVALEFVLSRFFKWS